MPVDKIIVKGARVHNLKNVNIEIPKNKLVVITGLSGSGKSSLAFDTIYAEGQRRYTESLSSFARQFMETRDKPAVDKIEGLSPTIAIDQRAPAQNPRSTVGTLTEIYDYLRLLFARAGAQHCPNCGAPASRHLPGAIVEELRKLCRQHEGAAVFAPLYRQEPVVPKTAVEQVEKSGLEWVRVNGKLIKINDFVNYHFSAGERYDIDLLVARLSDAHAPNLVKAVETALDLSNGLVYLSAGGVNRLYTTFARCLKCDLKLPEVDIRSFSFNSPYGACARCTGLGITMVVDPKLVIPNERLTLNEGAIQPWTRITGNQAHYQKLLAAVAARHGFSLQTPVGQLPRKVRDLLLYGTDSETYEVGGQNLPFAGVAADLTSRHLETKSDYVRREIEQYMRESVCPECAGQRLKKEFLAVKIGAHSIADLSGLSVEELLMLLPSQFRGQNNKIAEPIIKEMLPRLINLEKVGLGYLSLDRAVTTLSGGELTRARLSSQLSSGLTGVIYVLDEPSVGLHAKDNDKLIATLKYLRDLGNSVIVVEHDGAMMAAADYVVDIGPGAGLNGGEVVAAGNLAQIKKAKNSLTGRYLSGKEKVLVESRARSGKKSGKIKNLTIVGAKANNLKNLNVAIPLSKLICVTGVSGSGKSTLVIDILGKALSKHFYRAKEEPGAHQAIRGLEHINKVIAIDQSPIGRTPRSNPATYTGVFTLIRDLFTLLPESKMRHYDAGKFSFNVKGGGRCEACAGEGYIRIPMQFLADVYVECPECQGTRYNEEALQVHYHNKNIADVLDMTAEEAGKFFADVPAIADKLDVLRRVGLGYIKLGQPATTLSGGEAQRVKLATELARASTGKTLYILDEPTTGLHFEDVRHLLLVLTQLVDKGNTVLIIEHNLDIIRCADWVIDLGPEGGKRGGEVVAMGRPADIKKNKKSWTGRYL